MPKDLIPFARVAVNARARVEAALDDDLNTPVVLAILGDLAKAANELADLVQRRRQDVDLTRAAPFVGAQLLMAIRTTADTTGLLPSTPEAYRERTQAHRLAMLGLTAEGVEARLQERTAARQAKDFARADALRKETEALGIEVYDAPEGTTWRVLPGGAAPSPPAS